MSGSATTPVAHGGQGMAQMTPNGLATVPEWPESRGVKRSLSDDGEDDTTGGDQQKEQPTLWQE